MTTDDHRQTVSTNIGARVVEAQQWDELLGHLLDLAGQLVSVSADAIIVGRVRVRRTERLTWAHTRREWVELVAAV